MNNYKEYFTSLTASISNVSVQLAHLVEAEIPPKGTFGRVFVDWTDPKGELDIKEWRFIVRSIPVCDGGDKDKRYVEIIGWEDEGYGISLLVYGGYQAECIATLKSNDFVEELIQSMIMCLNA